MGNETYVLVLNVLEEFEFAVGSLTEDGCAEGLHDLLYRHRGSCELIFRGAGGDGLNGQVSWTRHKKRTRRDQRRLEKRVRIWIKCLRDN